MRNTRRILSFLMVLVLVLGLFPASALAAEGPGESVPADEPLTTLGETPDGLWRRVRGRATGRTGWMRGDVPDKGTP